MPSELLQFSVPISDGKVQEKSFSSRQMASLQSSSEGRQQMSGTIKFTCAVEFFYWAPTSLPVAIDMNVFKRRYIGEMILIGLMNSIGDVLFKCHPIGVCEDLVHSALGTSRP